MPRPSWFNRPTTYSTCSCGPGHQNKGNNGPDYLCPVCTVHKPVFMFKLVWSNHMHCGLQKAVSKAYLGRLHSSLVPRPPFNTARGGSGNKLFTQQSRPQTPLQHCKRRSAYWGRSHSSLIPRPLFNTARGGLHIGGVHTVVSSLDPPSTLQEEGLGTSYLHSCPKRF